MAEGFKFLYDKTYEPKQVKFEVLPSDSIIYYSIDDGDETLYDGNYLLIDNGKNLKYTASKSGYQSVTASIVITQNQTIPVSLKNIYYITFNVNPSDATIKYIINEGEQQTLEGNVLSCLDGDNVSYEISKTNYVSQSGSFSNINENKTVDATLSRVFRFTFNITPSDATIKYTIDGGTQQTLSGTVLNVNEGSVVNYTLERDGYVSYSASLTANSDKTITVSLVKQQHTITFNVTPSDATIKYAINSGSTQTLSCNTLIVTDGDVVAYEFSKTDYILYNSSLTASKDETITYTMEECIKYIFRDIDASGNLTLATGNLEDASKLTSIGNYGLGYAFGYCTGLTGTVSFLNLTEIGTNGLYEAFCGCRGLTGTPSFPKLTTIGKYGLYETFGSCTGLSGTVSFPSLTTVGVAGLFSTFSGCTGITGTVSFPKLTSIGNSCLYAAFEGCTGITGVSFPKLTTIEEYGLNRTFEGCTGITSVSFPSLTTIYSASYSGGLYNIFNKCTGITAVHFKSSMSGNSQCTVSNMGCTNATVYFDL